MRVHCCKKMRRDFWQVEPLVDLLGEEDLIVVVGELERGVEVVKKRKKKVKVL